MLSIQSFIEFRYRIKFSVDMSVTLMWLLLVSQLRCVGWKSG